MHCLSNASDLFHLRHTCSKYLCYTTYALLPLLAPKLKQLRVPVTKDGLETLLALLFTPEWRNCVECIELVDPGVEAFA
jgi:hypothetical protein